MFDTLMLFMKEFLLEKLILKKKLQMTKNHETELVLVSSGIQAINISMEIL